jgi:hypothetical protein
MTRYSATSVHIHADTDCGEGWVVFQWAEELCGQEELKIDLDGHCSRRMSIRSGTGPPEFVELRRDLVTMRFDSALAQKLQMADEIEISFHLSDAEFADLSRVIDYFNGAN